MDNPQFCVSGKRPMSHYTRPQWVEIITRWNEWQVVTCTFDCDIHQTWPIHIGTSLWHTVLYLVIQQYLILFAIVSCPKQCLILAKYPCHSPQTTFSSDATCCVLSAQKSAMHVVVYADRLTNSTRVWILSTNHKVIGKFGIPADMSNAFGRLSHCTRNFVCYTYLCFATTSTAENSTIQGRLKPSHNRLLRVNVSSHKHMT